MQFLALCGDITYTYQVCVPHPQTGKRVSGPEDVQIRTVAKPETQASTATLSCGQEETVEEEVDLLVTNRFLLKGSMRKNHKRQPPLQTNSHRNRRGKS